MTRSAFLEGAEWMRERVCALLHVRADSIALVITLPDFSGDARALRATELELRCMADLVNDFTLPEEGTC